MNNCSQLMAGGLFALAQLLFGCAKSIEVDAQCRTATVDGEAGIIVSANGNSWRIVAVETQQHLADLEASRFSQCAQHAQHAQHPTSKDGMPVQATITPESRVPQPVTQERAATAAAEQTSPAVTAVTQVPSEPASTTPINGAHVATARTTTPAELPVPAVAALVKPVETVVAVPASTVNREADWVNAHNVYRQAKQLLPLQWSAELAGVAGEWVATLASESCGYLEHRAGAFLSAHNLGENLALASASPNPPAGGPASAVEQWAAEAQFYDEQNNRCASGQVCGHYTQVVWRNTTEVGCAEARCRDGQWHSKIWACNYRPAGNVVGQKPW